MINYTEDIKQELLKHKQIPYEIFVESNQNLRVRVEREDLIIPYSEIQKKHKEYLLRGFKYPDRVKWISLTFFKSIVNWYNLWHLEKILI